MRFEFELEWRREWNEWRDGGRTGSGADDGWSDVETVAFGFWYPSSFDFYDTPDEDEELIRVESLS